MPRPIRLPSFPAIQVLLCVSFSLGVTACGQTEPTEGPGYFNEISVSVTNSGSGNGTVWTPDGALGLHCTFEGAGISPCEIEFDDAGGGGSFEVQAEPEAGYVLELWSGRDCTPNGSGACTINCGPANDDSSCFLSFGADAGDVDYDLAVRFNPEDRGIQLDVYGTGDGDGTITTPQVGLGLDCQIDAGLESGTCQITLEDVRGGGQFEVSAIPAAGSEFTGWDEDGCYPETLGTCSVDCGAGPDEAFCTLSYTANSGSVEFEMGAVFEPVSGPGTRDIAVNVTGAGLGEGTIFMPLDPSLILCSTVAGATSGRCDFEQTGVLGAGSYQVIAAQEGVSEFQGWDVQSCVAENPGTCRFDCAAIEDGESCELVWDDNSGDVTFDMTARFETALNTVVLEDDFEGGGACVDWTSVVVGNGTFVGTDGCEAAGGDPSGYRTMTHEVTNVGGVVVSHWYEGGSYDPSVGGAIQQIVYSESRIITQPAFVGGAVGTSFRLRQDGTDYTHTIGSFTDTAWGTHSVILTPGHFTPAPGPDFSAEGSEIQFGYVRSNSNTSDGATSTSVHGIDNWRVVIYQSP